jgi:hypothetical protein
MESAVLLRCPICNAVRALEGRRNEYSRQELYARVKSHLGDHDLDEPKMAIRKYGIVADATEIVIRSENQQQLPIEGWTTREDAWLPDGALSGGEESPSAPESSVEISSR